MPDACIGVRLSEKIRGQQLLELGEDPLLLRLREVLRRERECSSCLIPGYCHPIRLKTSSFAHVLRPGIKKLCGIRLSACRLDTRVESGARSATKRREESRRGSLRGCATEESGDPPTWG